VWVCIGNRERLPEIELPTKSSGSSCVVAVLKYAYAITS